MPPTGLIFDLQRTALHDGPGIRTAVFFKGCSLRCGWCHNPESQSREPEIYFRPEACVACGACAQACERGAHQIVAGQHTFDRSLCNPCGACARACLYEALKLTGEVRSVENVMAEVRRDRPFYASSGGGLTLTGGEPLLQPEFALGLLQAAKADGIHTCLETCGWASQRVVEQVLPWVDLFLFDYKATDPQTHRRLTGADNAPILAQLDFLYRHDANIRLRCPLVPGVNDTGDHLAGIAALNLHYPRFSGIDLLPYHNIGQAKYTRYGLANPLPALATTAEATKQGWVTALRRLGCEKAVLG